MNSTSAATPFYSMVSLGSCRLNNKPVSSDTCSEVQSSQSKHNESKLHLNRLTVRNLVKNILVYHRLL